MKYFDNLFFAVVLMTLVVSLFGCEKETKKHKSEKIAIETLKTSMHDPDSFEHISTSYVDTSEYINEMKLKTTNKDAQFNLIIINKAITQSKSYEPVIIVKLNYRGRNAFGALIVNSTNVACGESIDGNFAHLLKNVR